IDDVYKKMSQTRYRSYPVLNNQGKVLGAISRFHLLNYQKKKFILVDHNEMSQSIDNIKDADILEIVDHHRIGDIETSSPIRFRNEIIGSTCSIVAMMYRENRILPDPKVAAGMCYAIISDTMNFNSPTTTPIDHDLAQELADIAGINLENIAPEMFKAVATLKGKNLSEILYNDFKEYAIEGKRIAIGQINLADIHELEEIRSDFIEYLKTINTINKFDLLMMCFTNVEGKGSNLIFIGDLSWMVDEAFKEDIMDENYFVDGIMSRKKQIIPSLSRIIKED
ncbi:MAG: putative manganese-dependent inorganic diphosphatase, partial [Erysipelotrichaceae bacterium]